MQMIAIRINWLKGSLQLPRCKPHSVEAFDSDHRLLTRIRGRTHTRSQSLHPHRPTLSRSYCMLLYPCHSHCSSSTATSLLVPCPPSLIFRNPALIYIQLPQPPLPTRGPHPPLLNWLYLPNSPVRGTGTSAYWATTGRAAAREQDALDDVEVVGLFWLL